MIRQDRTDGNSPGDAFESLYDIVARLRGPEGCPWDRGQDSLSLRGNLLEETYECIEAIGENNPVHIKEELGDVFLLATMLAYFQEELGIFSVAEALRGVGEKLVRRHPHVFGGTKVKNADEVLDNWAKIKVEREGRSPKDSLLDEVSSGLPPLDRAWKLQKKAAEAGFDPHGGIEGAVVKIREGLAGAMEAAKTDTGKKTEEKLGSLLFSVIGLCRYLKVEPSVALHGANGIFTGRFRHVEKKMKETGREMMRENLALMDRYWGEAKDR